MNKRNTFYISIVVSFLVGLFPWQILSAQCSADFTVKTAITPSTCQSNGTVTVTLEGDVSNLMNIQYGLKSTLPGGFHINPQEDNVLSGIPPGTYEVTVRAFCSVDDEYDVVKTVKGVIVGGDYQVPEISYNAVVSRKSYAQCPTGIIAVNVVGGNGNFTFSIDEAPEGVTQGEVKPLKNVNTYTFPNKNYPAGNYKVSVFDGCNRASVDIVLQEISGLPTFRTNANTGFGPVANENDCGKLYWGAGAITNSNPDFYRYYQDGMYEVATAPTGATPLESNWVTWSANNIVNYHYLVLGIQGKFSDYHESNSIAIYVRLKGCNEVSQFITTNIRKALPRKKTDLKCDFYAHKINFYSNSDGLFCFPITVRVTKDNDTDFVREYTVVQRIPDSEWVVMDSLEYDVNYKFVMTDQNDYSYSWENKQPKSFFTLRQHQTFCEGYSIQYYPVPDFKCYPVYLAIKDPEGVVLHRDTFERYAVHSPTTLRFEYGKEYKAEITYSSASPVYSEIRTFKFPSNLPSIISVILQDWQTCTEDRGRLRVSSGKPMPTESVITITGPEGYTSQQLIVPASTSTYFYFSYTYLPPGTYTATANMGCDPLLTATLTLKGGYSGKNLHYTTERTCEGLKIYPKGAVTLGRDSVQTFYRLKEGPTGFDRTVRTSGDHFVLGDYGDYVLGILPENDATACVIQTDTIRYRPIPLSLSTHDTQTYVCVDSEIGTIVLKAINGVPPYTYELWDKENTVKLVDESIVTDERAIFNYGEADSTYTVRVEDACGNGFSQQITLSKLSTARIVYPGKSDVCYNDTIKLNCLTLGTSGYEWTGPNGFTSTDQNPRIGDARPAMSGWYRVSITPEFCNTAVKDSVYVTVYEELTTTFTSPDQQICVNTQAAELTSTVSGGKGTYTYQWQSSVDKQAWTDISGATSDKYTPALHTAAGDYYYRLSTTDECVTIHSATITIQVDAMPTAHAGADQAKHEQYSFTLNAESPTVGTGVWSVAEGSTATIKSPGDANSEVEVDHNATSATLVWSVTNGTCEATDTVVLRTRNYWHGSTDTDWDKSGNWTANIVPGEGDNIEYATETNNGTTLQGGNGKGAAVNDLVVSSTGHYQIGNLTNASTKNLIISASGSLNVGGAITITHSGTSSTDPAKIQVKAEADKPNGTLIVNCEEQSKTQRDVYVTVDLYAKGFKDAETTWVDNITGSPTEGQTFTGASHWQYIGIPVSAVNDPGTTFYQASIREYSEDYNGNNTSYYQKWKDIHNHDKLHAFKGYEITQDAPATYSIAGVLQYCDKSLTMTRRAPQVGSNSTAPNAHYGLGQNIFGNSFTSSIKVEKMQFPSEVEKTVYLYNTGRFTDWGNVTSPPNDGTQLTAGQYTAIPQETASTIFDGSIPSMNGFLVKFLPGETRFGGSSVTLNLPYTDGVKSNSRPQTIKRDKLAYLQVQLSSKSTIDNLWLFSQEGTSSGFDNGWDGRKYFGTPTAYIYTDTQGGLMQVSANKTIDGSLISFYANTDTDYTLTLSKSNLDDYQNLHLIDHQTKTIVPLYQDTTTYSFTAVNNGFSEERFQLVNAADIDLSSGLFQLLDGLLRQDGTLQLVNYTGGEGRMQLYDTTGRSMLTDILPSGLSYRSISLSRGVYVLYLESAGKRASIKLIVGSN